MRREQVSDGALGRAEALDVKEHFLAREKRREGRVAEGQHIWYKLVFDLVNEELAVLRRGGVRKPRELARALAAERRQAGRRELDAEEVRGKLLERVAEATGMAEPGRGGRGEPGEEAEADYVRLELAIERELTEMESTWECCEEEEQEVLLAVEEALFQDLLADTVAAFVRT